MNIFNCKISTISLEDTFRIDTKFLSKILLSEKYNKPILFNELFDIINPSEVDLDGLELINYCQIGDTDSDGIVHPVLLNFSNKDMDLEDYFNKIAKGDIFKPNMGDILVAKVRPYLKKIIHINKTNKDIFFTKAFICLRPKIDSNLLYFLVKYIFINDINNVSRQGKGYPTIIANDLQYLKFNYEIINNLIKKNIIEKILIKNNEILTLFNKILDHKSIINDIFSNYFGFDKDLFLSIGKGITYGTQNSNIKLLNIFKIHLNEFCTNYTFKFSVRTHNPVFKNIINDILLKDHILLKDILLEEIHRGITPKYDNKGTIPVIKIAHLKSDLINYNFEEYVSYEFYDEKLNGQGRKGDILISSTGKPSIGKIDMIEKNNKYFIDNHISILRINEKKYNNKFLVYFFRSILGYVQIERSVVGSTNQVELYKEDINNFILPNISLDIQQKIVAEVEQQINNNKKIVEEIKNIEEQIKALIFENI